MRAGAAALAIAVLVAACGGDDSDRATTTARPDASPGPALVLASPNGVELVTGDGESTTVSTAPAASAYAVGADLVAFQGADATTDVFPAPPAGAVRVWSRRDVHELATDPSASRVFLLDAGVVDGRPVALVAERFGEIGPDDTFEALVLVDLEDRTRTIISRRPAWESGHFAARLLPDGDVVGLLSAEAQLLLTRWTPSGDSPRWTVEVGVDTSRDLTVRDGTIVLIESAFDPDPGLTLTTVDAVTGDELDVVAVALDPSAGIDTGLTCRDWTSPSALVCGRAGGGAITVEVADGAVEVLASAPDAIPSVARAG